MGRYVPVHIQGHFARIEYRSVVLLVGVLFVATLTIRPPTLAEDASLRSEEQVAEHAKAVWESGAISSAIDLLDQGIQDYPPALTLQKLRGDILAASIKSAFGHEGMDRDRFSLDGTMNTQSHNLLLRL